MNAFILTSEQVARMDNSVLVEKLIWIASTNNEMDCEEALNILRTEIQRRLHKTKNKEEYNE